MQSISAQMKTNRQQGMMEVLSFIDKQAKDAHDQAKKLVDDAIERIVKASKNIYTYIENRRQAKVKFEKCNHSFSISLFDFSVSSSRRMLGEIRQGRRNFTIEIERRNIFTG